MLKARLARLWFRFCESDVHFDPLGGAYYIGNHPAADPVAPSTAVDVDDEWLRVGAAWSAACGLHRPESSE